MEYFALNYQGEPFDLFGPAHLIALGVVATALLVLGIWGQRLDDRGRHAIRIGLAVVLLLNEAGWHLWHLSHNVWTVQTMLPLHLCNLLVFGSAAMLVTRSYTLYEFAYFLGIGAASQALFTPGLGRFGFPHYLFFQAITSHAAIVAAAIYMTRVEGYRPTWHSLVRVAIWTNVYLVIIFFLNQFLGSNYLFIAYIPPEPTLIDLLGPWPWYILSMEAIGLVVFLVLYAPFWWHDHQTSRRKSTHREA
jgi:hypothetical integral membrane protein (TIGR02206 family)